MRITLLLAFLLVYNFSFAQKTDEERRQALREIAQKAKVESEARKKRVETYVIEKGVEARFITSEDQTVEIYDINQNGKPVYIATDNQGAAVTTGAAFLSSSEGLGLNLTGEGVIVGVWDGGKVRNTHVEFDDQVRANDSFSTLNFHATHVAGTITAKGINERAKGMAPNVAMLTHHWGEDEAEMVLLAEPDESGILLSNHSYGVPGGWNDGTWLGDPSVSDQEDWRFGFYDGSSRILDEIAYNAPYYLIARSAGNERDDSGGGPYPPDGPYDNIGLAKVAKNVITVGAVNKIPNGYESPEDVLMSNFSSWGPTDDGRIKPDLVGAGVNITSTFETGDEAYGTISGTSMATPNVVGTLALLQELHKKTHGSYMKSSTLKGLAIHTVNQTRAPGPDYSFGWGLMNGEGAAYQILQKNGYNKRLETHTINDGEQFSLEINPKEGTDVKVTICWTDLPGNPPALNQLDPSDLMLVNDLDVRIANETEEFFPYVLDPSNPAKIATTGDNFRDNVEKIEFVAGSSENYIITINHKGNIQSGSQEFSLIVSYETDERRTFYKLPDNAEWENEEGWSFTSGGHVAMAIPGPNDIVILDNNTFSSTESTEPIEYVLDSDVEIGGLIISTQNGVDIDLNGNDLTTFGGISIINGLVNFKGEGSIIMKELSQGSSLINGSESSFKDINLIIDYEFGGTANINSNLNIGSLEILNGNLLVKNVDLSVENIAIRNESTLSITNGDLLVSENFTMNESSNLTASGSIIKFAGNVSFNAEGVNLFTTVEITEGALTLNSNTKIRNLVILKSSDFSIKDGATLEIEQNLEAIGEEAAQIGINSDGLASIIVNSNNLICLDYVNVSGVNISGSGAFNAGINSTVENATGWQSVTCEDVVFSNFSNNQICENSVEKFTNESTGQNLSSKWYLDGELVSEEESTIIQFPELKVYEVLLEVTDDNSIIDTYISNISVTQNSVKENTILLSGDQLVSTNLSDSYQWFKDDQLLEGETGRTLNILGEEGSFFVVTSDDRCSRKSPEFEFRVTSADEDLFDTEYILYPNPASELLSINIQSGYSGAVKISMTELSGREIYSKSFEKNGFQLEESINTSGLPNGLYVITIAQGQSRESKLVAIEQ